MEAARWTIPASRMKAGREFSVPLSTGALGVLERARALYPGSPFVFPSRTGGAFGQLSGPATKVVLWRMYHVYGDRRFKRLADISNGPVQKSEEPSQLSRHVLADFHLLVIVELTGLSVWTPAD